MFVRTESIKSWLVRKAYHIEHIRAMRIFFGIAAVPEKKTGKIFYEILTLALTHEMSF